MKRLSAVVRAIEGGAAAITSGRSTNTTQRRFLRAELDSGSFSRVNSRWCSHHEIANVSGHPISSAGGGGYGSMFFSISAASLAEDIQAKELPESKKFLPNDVVLYQYEACPFCNKVKAFLDYHDIPYKIVEVNPINKKEIKWSDYKKVPILMVDGEQMVDSSDIIDKLFRRIHPDSILDGDEERKWSGWVDSHLVHVLSPNIYRTTSEALESFDYITTHGNFSLTERIIAKYAGAAAMYFVSKKLKKKHNITDERAALYEAAETWVDALKGREYLGSFNSYLLVWQTCLKLTFWFHF
ncbi:prostaglandin-E synthase [Sarracenia purpurea var. burkii]